MPTLTCLLGTAVAVVILYGDCIIALWRCKRDYAVCYSLCVALRLSH